MRIKVTADSTCDLSPKLVEQYDIGIIPLYVVKNGEPLKDGIEITPQDIFDHVSAGGNVCSTAAVNVADYLEIFGEYLKEYDAIVHFTISSDMSACYQNAVIAANELGNVYPVDSMNLSTGIGHLVLDAADMAHDGVEAQEIQRILDEKKSRLDVSFVLDTLTYLHKGGRCSGVAALGANLLGLKPCIEVGDGKMGVGKKYRGTLKKCLLKYVEDRLKDNDDVEKDRIFITDSGLVDEIIDEIEALIQSCGPFKNVYRTTAGCTISNHCGPGCCGILYYRKK